VGQSHIHLAVDTLTTGLTAPARNLEPANLARNSGMGLPAHRKQNSRRSATLLKISSARQSRIRVRQGLA
jgi:hypothetical protein